MEHITELSQVLYISVSVSQYSVSWSQAVQSQCVSVCVSLCQDSHSDWPEEPTGNQISLLARPPVAVASADTKNKTSV